MKLCTDCKRLSGSTFCEAPENGLSTVDGEPLVRYALVNRGPVYFNETACGHDAIFFAPKEPPRKPWWKRIFNK